jgi:UDP-N-acetylmuramoylalanine--D-glutamate ligase
LEYRLQKIGSKVFKNKNLEFFNDSYSTRPEAAISAAESMSKPFAIILGGSEKHADFTELSQRLAANNLLNGIALIGVTAERLQSSLQSANCKAAMQIFEDLPAAFQWCLETTPDNGAILLSPACASFGLFANYKERGEKFNFFYINLHVNTK